MATRDVTELKLLMAHRDQRVRSEAQWELARRADAEVLNDAAKNGASQLARIHGLWGLWQLALAGEVDVSELTPYLNDSDAEIRTQALKIIGDASRDLAHLQKLVNLLNDPSDRVKMHAALAIAQMPQGTNEDSAKALTELLRTNNNADPYLRYACSIALAKRASDEDLIALRENPSPAVRLGAVIALRKLKDAGVAQFLEDSDAFIREETARAINDEPIPKAYSALAATLSTGIANEETMRRALNANLRVAKESSIEALTQFAANQEAPLETRQEALGHLAQWTDPYPLDGVVGMWRPIETTTTSDDTLDRAMAGDAIHTALAKVDDVLLRDPDDKIRSSTASVLGQYEVLSAADQLFELVRNDDTDSVRIAALQALAEMRAPNLVEAIERARDARSGAVRIEAVKQLARTEPQTAVKTLYDTAMTGSADERRAAILALGFVDHPDAESAIAGMVADVASGTANAVVQVEILEAAEAMGGLRVARTMKEYRDKALAEGGLAPYAPALIGGSTSAGRRVYFEHTAASCQRCHVIKGKGGGGGVGPDLSEVGVRLNTEQILESIVAPNAAIAEGYENVTLEMSDGTEIRGRILKEDDATITLEVHETFDLFADTDEAIPHSDVDVVADASGTLPDYPTEVIQKADIDQRTRNLSAMPDGLADTMSLRELRDLIAYLGSRN